MKILQLLFIFVLVILNVDAQEAGKFRGGFDFGGNLTMKNIRPNGLGIMTGLEFKYNIRNNMNVGFRSEGAIYVREAEWGEGPDISGNIAYLGTYDYYFNDGTSLFAPFVGGGMGLYHFPAVYSGDPYVKFGGFVRGGFEKNRFRMQLTCNIVPRKRIMSFYEDYYSYNSYFSLAFGFYFGGGSWNRN